MTSEITVRQAAPGDLDALLALYRQLHDVEPPIADGARAAGVLEGILATPARHLIVATIGGRVLGTADLLIASNLTHGARPWALIENVVVELSSRRAGVGGALMRALIAIARDAGCYRILLTSDKGRHDAHAFYRALGFDAVAEGFKLYFED